MRRPIGAAIVIVVGLVLVADVLVENPGLASAAAMVTELLVLLAAGAAIAGAVALVSQHGIQLIQRRGDRIGSAVLLGALFAVLLVGLRPDGAGASDPALRWVVAALIVPLGASLAGLLFIFLLRGAGRGMRVNPREATVLLTLAAAATALLLPVGGPAGRLLGEVSTWLVEGPVAAVFRGLLIGVAIAAALTAGRHLFGIEHHDD